jgi:hypothetical protein
MLYSRKHSNSVLYIFAASYTFPAIAKQDLLTEDSHFLHIMREIGNETSKTFPILGHLEMPMMNMKMNMYKEIGNIQIRLSKVIGEQKGYEKKVNT